MSSTVIKAQHVGGVAFNLEDLASNADVWLNMIRGQAAQLVLKAQEDAKAIRHKAEVDGRQAAEQAVDKKVQQKVAQQMQTVLPALQAAVARVEESRQAWLAHWEKQAVRLASRMAALVIRRELAADPQVPLPLIREALELAAGQAELRLVLSPSDRAALGSQVEDLVAQFGRLGTAQILTDDGLAPGGCRVETRFGVLDQSVPAQLARIEEELS